MPFILICIYYFMSKICLYTLKTKFHLKSRHGLPPPPAHLVISFINEQLMRVLFDCTQYAFVVLHLIFTNITSSRCFLHNLLLILAHLKFCHILIFSCTRQDKIKDFKKGKTFFIQLVYTL